MKSTGGLTHGSGMNEEQLSLWLMFMPITPEYHSLMQNFTGISFTTSEQHKEAPEARMERDATDLLLISKLNSWTPYASDPALRNIATGVVVASDVNGHGNE